MSDGQTTPRATSYQDLEVWQRGVHLAATVYRVTEPFPRSERFGLVGQMRRASISVPANIAEGWGRGSRLEYIRFLTIARGSLYEVVTHATIAGRVGYLGDDDRAMLDAQSEFLGRKLLAYVRSLQKPDGAAGPRS